MKKMNIPLLVLMAVFFCTNFANAQFDPEKVCRIENDQLIFTLGLKWTDKEKKEAINLFDLDSAMVYQVYKGKTIFTIAEETWKVKKINAEWVELSKPLNTTSEKGLKSGSIQGLIDSWMSFSGNLMGSETKFGANNFEVANAFVYTGKTARFYLNGHLSAQKVILSGSFNNWSTSQIEMKRLDKGWVAELTLQPGKYAYKYIIDGKWTTDPGNKLRERGEAGSFNSVVYCYNHIFKLNGFKKAGKVVVTGNFCNWNPRGVEMISTSVGWSLQVYLSEGTHSYKFLVDGNWMTDPENKELRADAGGNMNSFLSIGKPFAFKLPGLGSAKEVILTGTFNNWNKNELLMEKTSTGWQLPYVIPAGNYEYKFIVDGRWMIDPSNPFTSGAGETQNSFLALKANHVFELKGYAAAKKIIISGSFNNWNEAGYQMIKEGEKWIFPVCLKPGKYTYKFIADGKWILDPDNKLYEPNEYNTDNSVLWIEPEK